MDGKRFMCYLHLVMGSVAIGFVTYLIMSVRTICNNYNSPKEGCLILKTIVALGSGIILFLLIYRILYLGIIKLRVCSKNNSGEQE